MTDPTLSRTLICNQCPSYLTATQAVQKFGRSTGSPMCGRFGHVLGKPGAPAKQQTALQEHIAKNCPEFGQPMPSEPMRKMEVMLPIPELRDTSKIDPVKQQACSSCAMCKNFINETVVVSEIGWTASLCAAKGKLLLSHKLSYEARDCAFREVGTTRGTTAGMHFLPEYDDAFAGGAVNPVAAYFKMKESGGFVEPSDYPTDREVTEEDATGGIRAWRKFDDPDGSGNSVYFPVYDAAFFDDDERALIPKTGSDEHPELYVDHFGGMYGLGVAWTELDETPVFWGVAGVGKTELLRHAAWIMQLPFHRISITKSSEIDDIFGKMEYSPEKGTWFRYGRLPKAWIKAGVICLDEPNTGPEEVWQAIRPLTDNSKQLVLDMYDGRPLDRHPDCYMGMAMNPPWDVRNIGALEIADADSNRLFHTYIEMPPEPLEREIIKARVHLDGWDLSDDQLNMVMAIAKDLRNLCDEGQLPITWAIRQQIKVARALRWFSPPVAYRRAAADFLEPEAQQVMLDQVRAHWKEDEVF